jgi:hypothetical protein
MGAQHFRTRSLNHQINKPADLIYRQPVISPIIQRLGKRLFMRRRQLSALAVNGDVFGSAPIGPILDVTGP